MMTHRHILGCIALAAAVCLMTACASGDRVAKKRIECGERLAKAMRKYEARKYGSVKLIFEDVRIQCAGHPVADTAQFYLGMSLARLKLYADAKVEFARLTQDYPRSPFLEEARFRIGWCVFRSSLSIDRDQTETREAVRIFTDFLEDYPSSPFADSAQLYLKVAIRKLAEKEFNAARFYQKIGEKEAAAVCYRVFVKDYPASPFTPQARLNLGQMLAELGRTAEAREVLNALIEDEKTGEVAGKAKELLRRCN